MTDMHRTDDVNTLYKSIPPSDIHPAYLKILRRVLLEKLINTFKYWDDNNMICVAPSVKRVIFLVTENNQITIKTVPEAILKNKDKVNRLEIDDVRSLCMEKTDWAAPELVSVLSRDASEAGKYHPQQVGAYTNSYALAHMFYYYLTGIDTRNGDFSAIDEAKYPELRYGLNKMCLNDRVSRWSINSAKDTFLKSIKKINENDDFQGIFPFELYTKDAGITATPVTRRPEVPTPAVSTPTGAPTRSTTRSAIVIEVNRTESTRTGSAVPSAEGAGSRVTRTPPTPPPPPPPPPPVDHFAADSAEFNQVLISLKERNTFKNRFYRYVCPIIDEAKYARCKASGEQAYADLLKRIKSELNPLGSNRERVNNQQYLEDIQQGYEEIQQIRNVTRFEDMRESDFDGFNDMMCGILDEYGRYLEQLKKKCSEVTCTLSPEKIIEETVKRNKEDQKSFLAEHGLSAVFFSVDALMKSNRDVEELYRRGNRRHLLLGIEAFLKSEEAKENPAEYREFLNKLDACITDKGTDKSQQQRLLEFVQRMLGK